MKVALCCIGRQENRYIREFVEYYKNLGVDKIFLYDNNYDGEEHFEDVINDYIESGFVEITDFRNKSVCQLEAYQDCYDKHGKEYDWVCFFDIDEFLEFTNCNSIKEFLSNEKFVPFDMVHVNWKVYDDNDLVEYENKPLRERFTREKFPIDFKKSYSFPENNHVKSIVRGNLNSVKWIATPHTPIITTDCCNANGNECNGNSPFNVFNFDSAWLSHYQMKTIEEWLTVKTKRGYPDGNKNYFKTHSVIDEFFKINEMTDEKKKYLEDNGYIQNNIDIFICTHKEFEPTVHNNTYETLNAKQINDDIAENGLKGSFYSELMLYFHVAENLKLKKYVGFCHYRKYFSFLDDVPNMDEIFKTYDMIAVNPIKFNDTVEGQYAYCHNIEDLNIVGNLIHTKFNEYSKAYDFFIKGNMMFPCNMFIMKKENFIEYINFVKGVLDEYVNIVGTDIEKRINENKDKYLKSFSPNNTVEYQYRIGGYLAERLTNVFILKQFKKIKCYPMILTEQKYNIEKG